jgi:hypothetical protein
MGCCQREEIGAVGDESPRGKDAYFEAALAFAFASRN